MINFKKGFIVKDCEKIEPLKEDDKSWQLFKNKLMPEKINSYSMSMTKPMDIFEICNENLRDLEMDSLFYLVAKPFESWYYKQSADPVICNICFVKKELRKLEWIQVNSGIIYSMNGQKRLEKAPSLAENLLIS